MLGCAWAKTLVLGDRKRNRMLSKVAVMVLELPVQSLSNAKRGGDP